jgi:hypothetical protein
MKAMHLLFPVALTLFSACSAMNIQGEFAAGRQAFIRGDTSTALAHFRRIAERDPEFMMVSPVFRQSIWTYLGRAQYASGSFSEAKDSLEKGISHVNEDRLGRLYLGLALLRQPAAPTSTDAFSLEDVLYALREGVPSKRIMTLVAERGIAFELNKDTETQLTRRGADASLLDRIQKSAAENVKRLKAAGDPVRGGDELTASLTALNNDLNSINYDTAQGSFWDPGGQIRKEIQSCLSLLSNKERDWAKIIASGEWIGQKLEEEVDQARRDEIQERKRTRQGR